MGRNKSNQTPPAVVLHRDISTGQQLGMLMSVCANMTGVLLNPERDHENVPGQRSMDGEAFIAASTTFIKACDRIDSILEDSSRWGTAFQSALEKQYNEQHEASIKSSQAAQAESEQKRLAAAAVTAPHFRYKPMLVKLEEGGWAAFLGNTEDLDSGILGIGAHPEAALRSFDQAFAGKMSPEVENWLRQHEQNLEQGVETKTPFPKTENAKPLDDGRSDKTEGTSGEGENGS